MDNPYPTDNDYTLTDIPFDPQELDPDGVPGADVVQYVEETALRALSQGLMSMEMVRLGGTASRSNGPYDDGPDSAESS
ncbi:hypothetical protein, partial [Streptococcus pneumoniae]|uniref:hypothetical protein n=1 Tax=Streptococcus pneumoniae TaxID=1313 RepID=UPI001E476FE2